MYLPIETSFAIFAGGVVQGPARQAAERRSGTRRPKDRAENTGTLLASGLIAGEAIIGILFAALAFAEIELPSVFGAPSYLVSLVAMARSERCSSSSRAARAAEQTR